MNRYVRNVLVAFDQMVNAIFFGDPDETISSRWAKGRGNCRLCRIGCKVLGWIDRDHCDKSIELDEGGESVRK